MSKFTLISYELCPYVQRTAIILREKRARFERRDIDLGNKPDWFMQLSPFGKVPVLLVGETPLIESAVINEYLDETLPPRLHPEDPLQRAYDRGWVEYASALNDAIFRFYAAAEQGDYERHLRAIRDKLARLEAVIEGPYFNGIFRLVDAAFAPALQRLSWLQRVDESLQWFLGHPKLEIWTCALLARPSVKTSIVHDAEERFREDLERRQSYVWTGEREHAGHMA